jgi:hypothetical protein
MNNPSSITITLERFVILKSFGTLKSEQTAKNDRVLEDILRKYGGQFSSPTLELPDR